MVSSFTRSKQVGMLFYMYKQVRHLSWRLKVFLRYQCSVGARSYDRSEWMNRLSGARQIACNNQDKEEQLQAETIPLLEILYRDYGSRIEPVNRPFGVRLEEELRWIVLAAVRVFVSTRLLTDHHIEDQR